MLDWQIAYLGRHTFPAEVTDFELRQAFTFDVQEREDIRRSFRLRLRVAESSRKLVPFSPLSLQVTLSTPRRARFSCC
jgi:hypothetical protein